MLLTKNLSCCSIHTDEGVRPGGGDWPGLQHSPDPSMCVLCCCIIYRRQYGNLNMFLVVYACVGQEGYVLRRSADRGESLSWHGFLLKIAWYPQKCGQFIMVEALRFWFLCSFLVDPRLHLSLESPISSCPMTSSSQSQWQCIRSFLHFRSLTSCVSDLQMPV